jgi:hypothetical protein
VAVQPGDRVIGEVLAEVIALLRRPRRQHARRVPCALCVERSGSDSCNKDCDIYWSSSTEWLLGMWYIYTLVYDDCYELLGPRNKELCLVTL